MAKEEDVIYRKGASEAELLKARENTMKEHVKSHAKSGAFAGCMVFMMVGRYFFHVDSWLVAGIVGGVGAAFGAFVGSMEASAWEKRLRPNKPESEQERQEQVREYTRRVEHEQRFLHGGISKRFAIVVGTIIAILAILVILLSYPW